MIVLRRLSLAALLVIFFTNASGGDEALLKPFVLGSRGPGTVPEKSTAVKSSLEEQGFTIAGQYSPYPDATVIVVTNGELKANAAKSEHGGFGAGVRVSITRVMDEVQVAYTNPAYMANAYRMQGDLSTVADKLEAALGKKEEFGAKGLTPKKLRSYHYMIGMEYFNEPSMLAEYGSFEEAAAAVEAGLSSGKGGATKVYRIDIPEKKEAVFGVALKGEADDEKFRDDKFIMSTIDFKELRSTAHLPYEMLVSDNKVYALYARFRIAVSFPDLSMMGEHSFMNIKKSPEAIRKALTLAAGAQ